MAHVPRCLDTPQSKPPLAGTWGMARWFDRLIGRKRVRASVLVFAILIVIDVISGMKPHDVVNLRDPFAAVGLALVLCGLALRSWAIGILKKDTVLTTTGPYELLRHPLYFGSFLMMLGFCTIIGDWVNYVVILGPILGMYVLMLNDEERSLAGLFGADWTRYAQRTRRLIPRWRLADLRSNWTWAQWRSSHEYQTVGATLVAFVALKLWRIW